MKMMESQPLGKVCIWMVLTLLPCVTGYHYRILVLSPQTYEITPTTEGVPLSLIPPHLAGVASQAGVSVAWKEYVALLNTPADVQVDIVYADSKCSASEEQRHVLEQLSALQRTAGQLLVISYNCHGRGALAAFGVPVVSFGATSSLAGNGLLGQPSVPGVYDRLMVLLKQNDWHEVGLAVAPRHAVEEEILIAELHHHNITIVNRQFMSQGLATRLLWIVMGDPGSIASSLCRSLPEGHSLCGGCRYINIIVTSQAAEVHAKVEEMCRGAAAGVTVLYVQPNITQVKLPSYFVGKLREEGLQHTAQLTQAAHVYDVTSLLLASLHHTVTQAGSRGEDFSQDLRGDVITRPPYIGVTGSVDFDEVGVRKTPVTLYRANGKELKVIDDQTFLEMLGSPTNLTVGPVSTQLDGVPLWLLALMSSLAGLGIIYATAVMIFNLVKAKNKVIKMTSPNLNVLMLVGCMAGYLCVVLLGVDSGLVSVNTMESLHAASTFILPLAFSLIYGLMFAKSWRVFLVFKNINFNGKLTRDEHLLVGLLVMLLVDLAIVLPWYFVDPIRCTRRVISTVYQGDVGTLVYEVDDCRSSLQGVWIGLLYLYKALLILAGLYFTWQTRNITLPSLKDTKLMYIVVYSIVSLSLIALPSLLISYVGMKTRYAAGSLILWVLLTVTISTLFLPKIYLERKNRDAAKNVSAFNFLFSESMRKTQEAVRKCSLCFCCGTADDSERYAQEMLAHEIDTLKRTIKQKDATIRELNDRLYIGAEKFHEYLTTPKSQRSVLQAMEDKYKARKKQLAAENGITLHCPTPRHPGGPQVAPHRRAATSTPQRPFRSKNHDYEDVYSPGEDEGVYSSDSIPQQGGSDPQYINRIVAEHSEHYSSNHRSSHSPIHTVSNGHIASQDHPAHPTHSRTHSGVSLPSQRSTHADHYGHNHKKENESDWRTSAINLNHNKQDYPVNNQQDTLQYNYRDSNHNKQDREHYQYYDNNAEHYNSYSRENIQYPGQNSHHEHYNSRGDIRNHSQQNDQQYHSSKNIRNHSQQNDQQYNSRGDIRNHSQQNEKQYHSSKDIRNHSQQNDQQYHSSKDIRNHSQQNNQQYHSSKDIRNHSQQNDQQYHSSNDITNHSQQNNEIYSRRYSDHNHHHSENQREFSAPPVGPPTALPVGPHAPSPNQDSAYDDHTPSSDEQKSQPPGEWQQQRSAGHSKVRDTEMSTEYMDRQSRPQPSSTGQGTHQDTSQGRAQPPYSGPGIAQHSGPGIAQQGRQFSQIDIGAMEYDAVKNFQRTPSIGRRERFLQPPGGEGLTASQI